MTRSSPGQLEMDLAVTAKTVGLVRTIVRAHVRLWGLEPLVERTVLVLSELLTNVVKHVPPSGKSQTPSARLVLTRVPGDGLFLCVHDSDPTHPQLTLASPDAEDGRGVSLIAACADEYGVTPATGGGKDVWLTLFPGDHS
ncbi:ATP-binding protein [Streptomyces sp. NBC_00620]|uniref:ATP-binding protein n=1 Tax=Streptomyces sp. NBC_00620 TaxID=2903666 RepID=UPI0022544388|nr:ATP-binding protein [Streptomyces sp. NBC_00620]MCX4976469.1 ATP-binding protein [Streptomyces sp. NBC_00620]